MTKPADGRLEALYVLTLTLLATHEIDSAYWHEWTLFGVPGGVGLFLLIHLLALPPFLFGLASLARDARAGLPFAFVLAGAGVAAFGLHSVLLVRGGLEFRTIASVAILVATLLGSLSLALAAVQVMRQTEAPSSRSMASAGRG